MPWDATTFANHNHALHGAKAGHAAKIANHVLASTGDEGEAIATANKWAGRHAAGGVTVPMKDAQDRFFPDRGWSGHLPGRQNPGDNAFERQPPRLADRGDVIDPGMARGGILRRAEGGASKPSEMERRITTFLRDNPPNATWEDRMWNARNPQGNIDPRMEREPPNFSHYWADETWGPNHPRQPWEQENLSRGGVLHRDDGGGMPDYSGGIAGPTPSAAMQSPIAQSMVQRYQGYPTETLRELAARLGGTQQGRLIQSLLQKRQMMPQSAPGSQQAPAPAQQASLMPQPQQYRKGGTIRRDVGGMMPMGEAAPWWTRREATDDGGGFLHGATPGRADQVKTQAPPGAYVIPADVIAGLGQGNNLAGAAAMQKAIETGPWGVRMTGGRGRSSIPRPPPAPRDERPYATGGSVIPIFKAKPRSSGGANKGSTPVDLSHGEYVVTPAQCVMIGMRAGGKGDANALREHGHRTLDDWVEDTRAKQIKELSKLPGPVKS